ncbi:MAG TPA: pseudouridine synthase [Gemmataceae bacterium]|nr:pseudouridine synthase [Gemmataceae bacterium]
MSTRTFVVTRAESGRPLAEALRARLSLSWSAARGLVRDRCVHVAGHPCLDPARRLTSGERVEVRDAAPVPHPAPGIVIRFQDAAVVVADKPPGLTTMRHPGEAAEFGKRAQRFLPPTLADLLPPLLARGQSGKAPALRAVHRIDKETSGLVVFALTPQAETSLGRQFREHTIERRYLALVRGQAVSRRIESWLVRDRGDGRRGSGPSGEGQRAVTQVKVVEELGVCTLVECRLETGRTHQVRIHLGEAGTPLCGERVYDRPINGRPLPDGSGAKRVMLHAARLGFDHPATGKRMTWDSEMPADMAALLKRLRGQARAKES